MDHSNQIMIFVASVAIIVFLYKLLTHFTNYGSLLDIFTSRQKLKYKRLFMYLKGYNELIKLNDNNYYKFKKHIKTQFGFNLLYKAINTAPDVDMVLKEEDRIKDYLELSKSDKMLVSAKAHNLLIEFKIMPKTIKYDKSCFKKGHINFGYGFNGYHYTKISSLTHLLCAGKSGFGKSNLANYLIGSIVNSLDEKTADNNEMITKFIFCDFKGGVESAKFERLHHPKIQTITEFSELDSTLIKLLEIMQVRTKEIIDSQKLKQEHSAIMLFIDEFADIKAQQNSTSPRNQVAYEQINRIDKNLQELLRKARFTNIKIILCLQRPHTENISSNTREGCQSKIMLNVDDASLVIGDNAKDLPKLGIDSTKLEVGEYYFIDAATNINELLKCPYDESFEDGSYLFNILDNAMPVIKNDKTALSQTDNIKNRQINNSKVSATFVQNTQAVNTIKPKISSATLEQNTKESILPILNNQKNTKTTPQSYILKQSNQNKQKYIHLKTPNSANVLKTMFDTKSSYIVKLGKSSDKKLNFGFKFNNTTLFNQDINKAQYDLIISLIENGGSKLYKV